LIAVFSFVVISSGRPRGPDTDSQTVVTTSGYPFSLKVGTFGKPGIGSPVETATGSSVPALMCSRAVDHVRLPTFDVPGDEIRDSGVPTAVRDVDELDACLRREELCDRVPARAYSR
jgi:hypothetical protein